VVDDDMRRYYDQRAQEYDDWWLGTGLFADRDRPGWAEEVEQLASVLGGLAPARTLDVACGTGMLTRHLPGEVVALDQSEAMVRVASERMPHVRVVLGDAVPLPFEDGKFERVFTSHFYGHLLPAEREPFLEEARRVGAQLVIADSALREGVAPEETQERVLNDGSRHTVYKRFFAPDQLAAELGGGTVLHAGRWFVVVAAEPKADCSITRRSWVPTPRVRSPSLTSTSKRSLRPSSTSRSFAVTVQLAQRSIIAIIPGVESTVTGRVPPTSVSRRPSTLNSSVRSMPGSRVTWPARAATSRLRTRSPRARRARAGRRSRPS
jgi:demethylmenaquinone methyltransferase/2-methoxy-6-polyprenyl-1,4-benzoquinol methylase